MPTHANNPLIAVHPDTKARLDAIGKKGDTYNDVIVDLLNGKVRIPLKERHAKATKEAKRVIGQAATAARLKLR
jgi:hypothetical protein